MWHSSYILLLLNHIYIALYTKASTLDANKQMSYVILYYTHYALIFPKLQ